MSRPVTDAVRVWVYLSTGGQKLEREENFELTDPALPAQPYGNDPDALETWLTEQPRACQADGQVLPEHDLVDEAFAILALTVGLGNAILGRPAISGRRPTRPRPPPRPPTRSAWLNGDAPEHEQPASPSPAVRGSAPVSACGWPARSQVDL